LSSTIMKAFAKSTRYSWNTSSKKKTLAAIAMFS